VSNVRGNLIKAPPIIVETNQVTDHPSCAVPRVSTSGFNSNPKLSVLYPPRVASSIQSLNMLNTMTVQMARLNAPKYWLRLDTPDCYPSPTLSILGPHKVASWMQFLKSYRDPESYTLKTEAVYQSEIFVTLYRITNHQLQRRRSSRNEQYFDQFPNSYLQAGAS
jgi:hypothetical protein